MNIIDARRQLWVMQDDVLRAAAALERFLAGDREQSWVTETLAEMGATPESLFVLPPSLPANMRRRCEILIVDDLIERMTRPAGTRRLCYN